MDIVPLGRCYIFRYRTPVRCNVECFFFAQTGHPMRCIYANINKLPLRTIHGQHNMLSSPLCSPSPKFEPFSPQVRDSRLARRSSTRAPPHNGHARNTREHRAARALLARALSVSLRWRAACASSRCVCENLREIMHGLHSPRGSRLAARPQFALRSGPVRNRFGVRPNAAAQSQQTDYRRSSQWIISVNFKSACE